VFDTVLFYDGYNNLGALANQLKPLPEGVYRLKTNLITTKLSEEQLNSLHGAIRMNVIVRPSCDNYDRVGNVNLAFVHKDSALYNPDSVQRIEIARFITPFMRMDKKPDSVPFTFQVSYLQHIFQDQALRENYNFWLELDIFGVPYAANVEVPGCAGRSDVTYGSVLFMASPTPNTELENNNVFIPLFMKKAFHNRAGGTDTVGKTIRNITFSVSENLTDAQLVLITSNHGANSGGEEYIRRWHYVYFNDEEVLRYRPGRISCEPFRIYNTQPNGIYGSAPRTDASWQSFSNWCPGDVIDTRIIKLGALQTGEYKFTIEVPEATFVGGQGNFPLSLYFQGKTNGTIAKDPKTFTIKGNITRHNKPVSTIMVMYPGSLSATNSSGEFFAIVDSNATLTITPILRDRVENDDFTGFMFYPYSSMTYTNIASDMFDQNFRIISENDAFTGITILSSDTTVISSDTTVFSTTLRIRDSLRIDQVLEIIDTLVIFGEITEILPPYIRETSDTIVVVRTVQRTKILDTDEISFITIYPNPVFMDLFVKLSTPEKVDYVIYNLTGQSVLQGKLQGSSSINVQSLPGGIYYLKIIGEKTGTVKFVKH
ncbi:MAG: T9SS type A sorting domain-containing protein, partial [Bacteroidales bacterium]|nr:T9SS type A sorting domain-containing protein [Bacteroidales bacterium]